MRGLQKLQKSYECIGDVREKGLMVGVELVRDREDKDKAPKWRNDVIKDCFAKGLLLLGCGESTLRFCPPLTVNSQEIDVCLNILEDVLPGLSN